MSKKMHATSETIVLPANRDRLHDQLINKVRLNRYDMKFMVNIAEKYISRNLPLSPGQNDLYEKIVHKYRKQLRKLKVNYKDILALEWQNGIADIEVLRQQTFFRVTGTDNPTMQLYFNFNKKHIDEVRALIHDDEKQHLNCGISGSGLGNGQKYNFNFSNVTKTWSGPFNLYLFKKLYEFAQSHNIKIEDSVTAIADTMNSYGSKEAWTPSIRISNDRIYVSHIAESMLPPLANLNPEDLSAANIEQFARLGLTPPEDYASIAKYMSGASAIVPTEISTPDDVIELKKYIESCGRNMIFYAPALESSRFKKLKPDINAMFSKLETWSNPAILMTRETRNPIPVYNNTAEGKPVDFAEGVDNLADLGYNTLVTTSPLTSLIRSQSKIGKFALEADKVIYLNLLETK